MNDQGSDRTVYIVGGGIAGLNCADHLRQRNLDFRLFESSDAVGGRMRTDSVMGFRLDRGFQVFQSAYPEAQRCLDYSRLRLKKLIPGALLRRNGRWIPLCDPLRKPRYAYRTLVNPVGTVADRLKLGRLLWHVWRTPVADLLTSPDKSTEESLLHEHGFSQDFINSFLRPWLAGIFLDQSLSTSACFFHFVVKMLISGGIYYPQNGIQAIPDQLAEHLPVEQIVCNTPVRSVRPGSIILQDETRLDGHCVLATSMAQAAVLRGEAGLDRGEVATTCVYFAADRAPISEPILMLNGDGDGVVNHVFVMTNASTNVAPPGKTLLSVSLVGNHKYDPDAVRSQLVNWYGRQAAGWTELANYCIPHALPRQPPGIFQTLPVSRDKRLILCGDYCASASLNGALLSGRLAAEEVARSL